MKLQTFTIEFNGDDINKDHLESIIYQGLQWYEDVNWKNYSVKKDGEEEEIEND